jgi:hypothetical protein
VRRALALATLVAALGWAVGARGADRAGEALPDIAAASPREPLPPSGRPRGPGEEADEGTGGILRNDWIAASLGFGALALLSALYSRERHRDAARRLAARGAAALRRRAASPGSDAASPDAADPGGARQLGEEDFSLERDEGRRLLALSRSELERGQVDAATEAALDAHWLCRSRESLAHLLGLLTATRRFAPEDGERLRRAASRHPREPVLLHAAGVFEAMHGDPRAAAEWLRSALRLDLDEETQRPIAEELARVEELVSRAGGGDAEPTPEPAASA